MELIQKYFPTLSEAQLTHFSSLQALYVDWNEKINVISRKDMDQFYCNHVLHSLAISKYVDIQDGTQILDIGTGGGFPGIPLAILYPNCHFTLVDSIRKKTKVAQEVSTALGLENVTVINDRFENITKPHDLIVSRAVAQAEKLVDFTKNALANNGQHIFLKGGGLEEERKNLLLKFPKLNWEEHQLSSTFKEDFFETKKIILLSKKK